MEQEEPLDPSILAQFIKHDRCPRYLAQAVDPDGESQARNWSEAFGLLNLSLLGDGKVTEAEQVEQIAQHASIIIAPDPPDDTSVPGHPHLEIDKTWNDPASLRPPAQQIRDAVRRAATLESSDDRPPYVLLYQPPLRGEINNLAVSGSADLIALAPANAVGSDIVETRSVSTDSPTDASITEDRQSEQVVPNGGGGENSTPDVVARVIDIKSAHEEQAAHRVQVGIYCSLLEMTFDRSDELNVSCRIGGAICIKESTATTPFELDGFRQAEWQLFVRELLDDGGAVDRALDYDISDTPFAISQVCNNCNFKEACSVRAVEQVQSPASLALLGLPPDTQRRLCNLGIDSLAAFADLLPRDQSPTPTDTPDLTSLDSELLIELEQALPGPTHEYIQKAQAIRGEYDPQYPAYPWPPALKGRGFVPLPNDAHARWGNLADKGTGDLIHVALIIRPDSTIDRVASLGACVTAENYDGYETMGEVIDAIPDDAAASSTAERELLKRFLENLFTTIESVASDIGDSTNAALHFYTYTTYAEEALIDALDRHLDCGVVQGMRDLLSLRADARHNTDQTICSTVLPIINNHFALLAPSRGLLSVVEQFDSDWHMDKFDPPSNRPDAPRLRVTFSHKFLNRRLPLVDQGDHVRVDLSDELLSDPYGWSAIRKRNGAQFPLEYIWAVTPENSDDDTPRLTTSVIGEWGLDEENRSAYEREIEQIRARSAQSEDRVRREDVTYLLERLAFALVTLVDNIPFKNNFIEKQPLDTTQLDQFSIGGRGLSATLRDYLGMEFGARCEEVESLYRQPLRIRLRTGRSLPVRCVDYTVRDDGTLIIDGELAYETVADSEVADGLRQRLRASGSDEDSAGGGSWRVLTPLVPISEDSVNKDLTESSIDTTQSQSATLYPTTVPSPRGPRTNYTECLEQPTDIRKSPPGMIEEIDIESGSISLRVFPHQFQKQGSRFRRDHRDWVTPTAGKEKGPESSEETPPPVAIITDGLYVLDPMIDDFSSPKADNALRPDTISANALYQDIQTVRETGNTPPCGAFPMDPVDSMIDRLINSPDVLTPTADQRAFIKEVIHGIVLLQGPPGSGKTSGAIAPAVLARAFARAQSDDPCVGIITGPSHTAVDGVLDDVASQLAHYRAAWGDFLPDLELIRVLPGDPDDMSLNTEAESIDPTYCSYATDTGSTQLSSIAGKYCSPQHRQTDDSIPAPCLLFATPSTLSQSLKIIAETLDTIDGKSAPAAMRHTPGLVDFLCVDEASMLDLPRLMLAGSTLRREGQALLVGDYRQLSTVQQHDWASERRRPIITQQPHLSSLDYFRWINHTSNHPSSGTSNIREIIHGGESKLHDFNQR